MQKPLTLSVALCLSLTGCQVFVKSKTWNAVVSVRPGDSFRQADPSAYYAEKLHQELLDQGVEHYVVTYQYHYYTGHYEEALGTRTAVVYRDEADSRYPWWLKDDRTATPFWLPAGELNAQLSFYSRRKAEVIEKKHYPAHGGGKEVVTPRRPAQNKAPKTHVVERSEPVTKIQRTLFTASGSKPLPEIAASAPETARSDSFRSPPAAIDPVPQTSTPAPSDSHLEKLFRARNGTSYDRTSATDRRKMEQLKQGLPGYD